MENQSTSDYAQEIAESIINGQKKQALTQFERAIADHCNVSSLLAEIAESVGSGRALIDIAAAYIQGGV